MAYSSALADDIRMRIGSHPAVTEKEMFGGIAFMINGNMAVGVTGDELMVRAGKEAHDEREAGATYQAIAEGLNADGVETAQGGRKWWPSTVRAVAVR